LPQIACRGPLSVFPRRGELTLTVSLFMCYSWIAMLEETNTRIDSVSLPLQDQLLETKPPETLQEALDFGLCGCECPLESLLPPPEISRNCLLFVVHDHHPLTASRYRSATP
jgi:hypothetical protein